MLRSKQMEIPLMAISHPKSKYSIDTFGNLVYKADSGEKLRITPNDRLFYVDLFCGAGGVSTGVIRAGAKVIMCINHDPIAIESHKSNHKNVIHAVEDIRNFDLTELTGLIQLIRLFNPNAKICLWASLECTHFSKAKGGDHRDEDSRTLANHLFRYIEAIDPDYIDIENVTEFMSWGPLRIKCAKHHENRSDLSWDGRFEYQFYRYKGVRSPKLCKVDGKKYKGSKFIGCEIELKDRCELQMKHVPHYRMVPKSKDKGKFYIAWIQKIQEYGYDYDYRILNAADFGALTSRSRYFGQFKKPGLPFTWPTPTHAKNPRSEGMFGGLKKWKAVKPALDLEDEGKSIFNRKKELVNASLNRIYNGLVKHVGDGREQAFITKWMSGNKVNKSIEEIFPTVTTMNHFGIVTPEFLMKYHGKGDNTLAISSPASTLTTKDRLAKLQIVWLDKQFRSELNHQSVDRPAGTILTNDKHCKMTAVWIDKAYSGEKNHQGVEQPLGTIMTKDKYSNIQCFIMNNYTSGGQDSSIENPVGSITTVPKSNVIHAEKWLMNHTYNNVGSTIDNPSPTLLASRKHFYIMNPQWDSKGNDLDRPCFTLIARMDKAPPSLIDATEGEGAIIIYEDDSDIIKKIKLFMAYYGIVDIKMRMLKVDELLRIQGFGDQYILKGNQTLQKKFIGNSVEVNLAKAKVTSRISALSALEKEWGVMIA
jgi:DNA (cytosine-5)-methyltransferase 1